MTRDQGNKGEPQKGEGLRASDSMNQAKRPPRCRGQAASPRTLGLRLDSEYFLARWQGSCPETQGPSSLTGLPEMLPQEQFSVPL